MYFNANCSNMPIDITRFYTQMQSIQTYIFKWYFIFPYTYFFIFITSLE